MLKPKVLLRALLVNISLIIIVMVVESWSFLTISLGPFILPIIAIVMLVLIFREKGDRSNAVILGALTYLAVGNRLPWLMMELPEDSSLKIVMLFMPAILLSLSYYFFRKREINLAKAIAFFVIVYLADLSVWMIFGRGFIYGTGVLFNF